MESGEVRYHRDAVGERPVAGERPVNSEPRTGIVIAGIPAVDMSLYHRIRFLVGDPSAWISWEEDGEQRSALMVRDIEMDRARRTARADEVTCPSEFEPPGGLSGDRGIATAQATAEFLVRHSIGRAIVHRDLPVLFAECFRERGIDVVCDRDLGIVDRRSKDEEEIQHLRAAQLATESAMRLACETIARADVDAAGTLLHEGRILTSEMVRSMIDLHLIELGFSPRPAIVACGPMGADCHELGSGPLRTGEPVIVDIFPQDKKTRYNGDCTRTVVHGDISTRLAAMHAAVSAAKAASEAATRAGVTGQAVHEAGLAEIRAHGFGVGLPPAGGGDYCGMVHGTGHGLGLDVHESPLLDFKGPELMVGDALTIEPGLYDVRVGGIRLEDLVIVTADGCVNVNTLPEGLDWR